MPRTHNISVQNTFIKGLVTEATGLTFPENACTETWNCLFDKTGKVSRRYPFDFEANYSEEAMSVNDRVMVSYVWKNVAGQGEITFVVVQQGRFLHFYRVTQNSPLSDNKHATVIDLNGYTAPAARGHANTSECQFASGNGKLFVTNPILESVFIEYDVDDDDFTTTEIEITIRDMEGIDESDELEDDERPKVPVKNLGAVHYYNLRNQGWSDATLEKWGGIRQDSGDNNKKRKDSPSNCDVDWYYKNEKDRYDFDLIGNRNVGNSPAPRGRFKWNLYDINRATRAKHAGNTSMIEREDIRDRRLSTCAFYAGRVFYSGLEKGKHNSRIYFTKIIERNADIGMCHQVNDPTSELLFDLLPSDGGWIDIQEAGSVVKMIPVMNHLIIFTNNGVWGLTGSEGVGFTANDYSLGKLSSHVVLSHKTFVDVEGVPYWWNHDGIWTLKGNQSGTLDVVSLTDDTIKDFFDEIPTDSKQDARGAYDPLNKVIQWVYRSSDDNDGRAFVEQQYAYDRVLNFNIQTGAFYPWSVGTDRVTIHGIFNVYGSGGKYALDEVIDGNDNVMDVNINRNIVTYTSDGSGVGSVTKYLVSHTNDGTKVTFAESREDQPVYADWYLIDEDGEGDEYVSYFVAGYFIKGQAIRRAEPAYLKMFSENLVDNAYRIRGRWNYSTAASTGKWSGFQTFTNTANNFQYKPNRMKIRGSGIACQFEVSSVDTTPFHLIGWSMFESANKWV